MAIESEGWTRYDKLAGLAALVLISGYFVSSVQAAVGASMQAMLGPATTVLPFSVLILLLGGRPDCRRPCST